MRRTEYFEENNLLSRNKDGNLEGIVKCKICNKSFEFEENKNSEAIAVSISETVGFDPRSYIDLEIVSKCTHCGYKIKHTGTERTK